MADALGARILAFEFAHEHATTALERAVLRCARDLRELLLRASSIAGEAWSDRGDERCDELAARFRVAYAWIVARLDHFSGSPTAVATSAAALAWFNVPRAVDDEVLAIVATGEGEGEAARRASLAALAPLGRRLRGAMHRLALLTTNAV